MGKKTDLKLNKANARMAEMRCALEGVHKAVTRMMETEETSDYMQTELAAVGLRQAMEVADRTLGGPEWDKWGEWQCFAGEDVLSKEVDRAAGMPEKVFRNNIYEVWVTIRKLMNEEENPPVAEMSIKRRDKLPIDYNHWRIIQRIKNELLGAGADAAMLYPCHQREQDSANQYRIYAMPPGMLMPFGDTARLVSSKAPLGNDDPRSGGRQRPFEKDEKPYGDISDNPAMLKAVEESLQKALNLNNGGGEE